MPPVIADTITLRCPFADGTNGQGKLYHLAEFDDGHNPITRTITAESNQSVVSATVVGKDVDIRTVGVKPPAISQASVFLKDGRTNPDGTEMKVTITVMLTASTNGASLEIASSDPVRDLP